ncbi:L-ascorbate metabolism protein UlaG (beta-lactamase superfamily) [Virgibacillus halotolerans]|uniref:MBL fold metallo-hydrolase n=1 Tax=Virgibacillus halotolerans TaxID=1071053 RepID=UPI0019614DCE|nr:MBL fold metallo-hydrolase [Virgibacillus halotolerans]MBM7600111.1 L-ascorbate metabolism protein UlaG (beta-lactamase superfamily) [Virgibacillus halotolerans]
MSQKHIYRYGKSLMDQINGTKVNDDAIAIWHLGQSGLVLKSDDLICYFDPYLSNYIEDNQLVEPAGLLNRNFDPPLNPEEIKNADIVFISHDHLDHLDPETLEGIAENSPYAQFVCPAPSVSTLEQLGISTSRIYSAKTSKVLKVNGITISTIPAKHEAFLLDKNSEHYYVGYVLAINGVVFYHAGDTVVFDQLVEYLRPHGIGVAYLPINGSDWYRSTQGVQGNMDFRDAIELAQAAKIDLIIPAHYDLFQSNTENPAYFVHYIYEHYPNQKFKIMSPGERFLYLTEG